MKLHERLKNLTQSVNDKIVLAIDLDEVVFQYLPGLKNVMVTRGLPEPENMPHVFCLHESGWFESRETFKKFHGDAVEAGLYEALEMVEDASTVLRDLHKRGYEINIVTSRFVNPGQHGLVVPQTARALELNRIPYSNLLFLADKTRFLADAYVDDAPHNLEPLQALGRFTIAFDQGHNQDVPGARANNWKDVSEILRERFGR